MRTISAELFKMRRQRVSWILPLALGAVAVLLYLLAEMGARRDWIGVPSGYFVASSVIQWMINVMILVTVVVTSTSIASEFSAGTVRSAWVRPLSRRRWFMGKVAVGAAVVIALFTLVAGLAAFLGLVRLGLEDLRENQYVLHTSGALGGRLLLSLVLSGWALCACVALAALFASFASGGAQAIALGIGAGIALTMLGVIPAVRPFLLSTYIQLPADQMVAMSKGLPLTIDWATLSWRTLGCGAGWMIAALGTGAAIIGRREIHA